MQAAFCVYKYIHSNHLSNSHSSNIAALDQCKPKVYAWLNNNVDQLIYQCISECPRYWIVYPTSGHYYNQCRPQSVWPRSYHLIIKSVTWLYKKKKKKSCVQSIDLRYINKRCIDRNKHASIDKVYFYNIYRPVSKCKAFFSFTF